MIHSRRAPCRRRQSRLLGWRRRPRRGGVPRRRRRRPYGGRRPGWGRPQTVAWQAAVQGVQRRVVRSKGGRCWGQRGGQDQPAWRRTPCREHGAGRASTAVAQQSVSVHNAAGPLAGAGGAGRAPGGTKRPAPGAGRRRPARHRMRGERRLAPGAARRRAAPVRTARGVRCCAPRMPMWRRPGPSRRLLLVRGLLVSAKVLRASQHGHDPAPHNKHTPPAMLHTLLQATRQSGNKMCGRGPGAWQALQRAGRRAGAGRRLKHRARGSNTPRPTRSGEAAGPPTSQPTPQRA